MYFMYMTVSVSMVASDQTLCVMVTATLLTLYSWLTAVLYSKIDLSGTLRGYMIKKTEHLTFSLYLVSIISFFPFLCSPCLEM